MIKNLHHTTDVEKIKQELGNTEHKTRNIMNGRHRSTKKQLNIFFLDFEPAPNNKDVYEIEYLSNRG